MRYDFVDDSRGIAMLIVVFWHVVGVHSPWVDGWVMPLFFIIMGMFYRQTATFKEMLVKKTNTLLLPHVICSVPAVIISLFEAGLVSTGKKILNPYECINPVSWFLVSMFFSYLVYWIVNRISMQSMGKRIILALIVSLLGFYSSQYIHVSGHRLVFPFYVSTSLTSIGFIEMGRVLSRFFTRERKTRYQILLLALSLLLFLLDVRFLKPATMAMKWNEYGTNWIFLMTNAFIGSLFVMQSCRLLESALSIFKNVGKLSLLILTLHMYVWLHLMLLFDGLYAVYVLTCILTFSLAWFIDKRFPVVTGRIRWLNL